MTALSRRRDPLAVRHPWPTRVWLWMCEHPRAAGWSAVAGTVAALWAVAS